MFYKQKYVLKNVTPSEVEVCSDLFRCYLEFYYTECQQEPQSCTEKKMARKVTFSSFIVYSKSVGLQNKR
ncbi:MAG: hypothetical protein A2499_13525 [Stygiobacter sp. RIFOXYC12_FULL_38_8]|nr:MAG: hypothetical protein A2X62_16055 [Stygiobacter sp. GWC2_38_9]OGV07603.1 MAG: hypothetical protein A2299_05445 [Stygiobacter sp. RIFOXYB2_FULL_37_11]OGV10765.1 MAG: hypothetical protein A2237_00325 [Stygiobacter sp. RIFOXYA2_FULL_38_8]OGV12606.1 MAG: hypothetical protein A2440_15280 [Stygiobacter sp. RIFOXYC2_FULL_38_25]OGV26864.1 MAG: hypothetical protein A2499_13525 [Stygiobacter sp. RIFOXYC12_FULL_38_8]OGV78871.1 MAG: hypothetical protein A2X65_09455 [Stygiobacter sp. GWF2_38_21]OGV